MVSTSNNDLAFDLEELVEDLVALAHGVLELRIVALFALQRRFYLLQYIRLR